MALFKTWIAEISTNPLLVNRAAGEGLRHKISNLDDKLETHVSRRCFMVHLQHTQNYAIHFVNFTHASSIRKYFCREVAQVAKFD